MKKGYINCFTKEALKELAFILNDSEMLGLCRRALLEQPDSKLVLAIKKELENAPER